jgi:putative ABC transport system permease protein
VVAGWVGGSLLAPVVQVGIEGLGDRPGVQFGLGPLLVALVLVEAILALSVIVPAWRAGHQPAAEVLRDAPAVPTGGPRLAALARRLEAGPSTVTGVRRALARPLRATLAGGALLVAAVGAMIAVGFIGVLELSATDSADTGVPWTAYATPTGATPAQIAATLDRTPEAAAWYIEQTTKGTVGADAFTVRVLGGEPDAAGYLVREGRPASGPGQAMVGYGFLARTGHRVGDTIDLQIGDATAKLEIVGWFSDLAEGGQIIQLRREALPASVALEEPPTFRLVAADGVAPAAMATAVAARLGDGATVVAPRLNDGGRAQGIAQFAVLTLVLGGIAVANLLAVTVAGQRERARSLGILRAVGCTTRQLIGQTAVGTAAIGLVAGLLGAPLGWLLFRVAADATTKAAGLGPNPIPHPPGPRWPSWSSASPPPPPPPAGSPRSVPPAGPPPSSSATSKPTPAMVTATPPGEEPIMRKAALAVGLALGLYLIVRAAAEPFVIDLSDPATYRDDWGGPSLIGVLLVHSGPGVVAAIAIAIALIRHRSSRHAQPKQPSRP